MEARLGNNPSYIWRSLIWSKDVIADGVLWRVGDGKDIRISDDNWIPSMKNKLGASLVQWAHAHDLTVSALIREGAWDSELISNNFNAHVASEILKIPLPTSDYKDARFWKYDSKGKYSVRDGYRLQKGMFDTPAHQSAFPNEYWWGFVWSLSLPPKIRIFWWQVSHDCIPTNHNLWRHHVPVTGSCSICGASIDSTCHSLFFCSVTRHLWKTSQFSYLLKIAKASHTMELCLWMKNKLLKSEFESFAIHTWAVWKERQSFIHGTSGQRIAENVDWCGVMLCDFQHVNSQLNISNEVHRQPKVPRWSPPDFGLLKLNTDACVNKEADWYSIGGVLRDHQSRLLLAFGNRISQPISVVHGELLAVLEGAKLLYEKNFKNVVVETDSLLAVQAVAATQEDLGYVGICATDVGESLRNLAISEFSHVYRSANVVAHHLARFVSSSRSSFVWMNGEFPSWLVQLVMDDFSQ